LPKDAVRSLPVGAAFTDGEAVALRPDGHSNFEALRTKYGAATALEPVLLGEPQFQMLGARRPSRRGPVEQDRQNWFPAIAREWLKLAGNKVLTNGQL